MNEQNILLESTKSVAIGESYCIIKKSNIDL